jgi:hypothetical protein
MTRQDRQTQLADCLKRVDFLSEEQREELYKYRFDEVAMQDNFDYPDCFGSQFGEWFLAMLFIEFGCDEKRTNELIDRHYLAHLLRCKETMRAHFPPPRLPTKDELAEMDLTKDELAAFEELRRTHR